MEHEQRPLISTDTKTEWNDRNYLETLQKNINWLSSLGINIPRSGRYSSYLRVLNHRANMGLSEGMTRPSPSRSEMVLNARYETHELDRLRRRFIYVGATGWQEKLKEVVSKGPNSFRQEKVSGSSSSSRNTMAELMAGAYIAKSGLVPHYGDDAFPEPAVRFDGELIVFECKRLGSTSPKAAARNIHEAAAQIDKHALKGLEVTEGVVYLDITRVVCENNLTFVGTSKMGPVLTQARDKAVSFYNSCIREFPFQKYQFVSGIVIRAAFMIIDTRSPEPFEKYATYQRNRSRNGGCLLFEKMISQDDKPEIASNDSDEYTVSRQGFIVDDDLAVSKL